MTGQPGFAAGEMRPNGSKGRGESGSRVWEKRKAPAFAGLITSLRRLLLFKKNEKSFQKE